MSLTFDALETEYSAAQRQDAEDGTSGSGREETPPRRDRCLAMQRETGLPALRLRPGVRGRGHRSLVISATAPLSIARRSTCRTIVDRWVNDDALKLARGLRATLDKTASTRS
jgi:hypothetical protein